MAKVKAKMQGGAEMAARLRRLAANYPNRVAAGLYQEGQIEMTEAKRRTPVDTTEGAPHPGQLRNSGQVLDPVQEGKRISVTLAFGGGAVDYAIHVHENPDALHPVGQWKYLESTLNESRSNMAARVGARVRLDRE